jgi:hypothetical protein
MLTQSTADTAATQMNIYLSTYVNVTYCRQDVMGYMYTYVCGSKSRIQEGRFINPLTLSSALIWLQFSA